MNNVTSDLYLVINSTLLITTKTHGTTLGKANLVWSRHRSFVEDVATLATKSRMQKVGTILDRYRSKGTPVRLLATLEAETLTVYGLPAELDYVAAYLRRALPANITVVVAEAPADAVPIDMGKPDPFTRVRAAVQDDGAFGNYVEGIRTAAAQGEWTKEERLAATRYVTATFSAIRKVTPPKPAKAVAAPKAPPAPAKSKVTTVLIKPAARYEGKPLQSRSKRKLYSFVVSTSR